MARIFTISFRYNEETHNTMVSVRSTPYYMEYTFIGLDPHLLLLLPENKVISPTPKNFFFQNAGTQHSTALMNAITKAVATHLQTFGDALPNKQDEQTTTEC